MPKLGNSIAELVQHRDLLFMLTWRDIKIRYKQSVMGFFWAILMPALIISTGVLVRYVFSAGLGQRLGLADVRVDALLIECLRVEIRRDAGVERMHRDVEQLVLRDLPLGLDRVDLRSQAFDLASP